MGGHRPQGCGDAHVGSRGGHVWAHWHEGMCVGGVGAVPGRRGPCQAPRDKGHCGGTATLGDGGGAGTGTRGSPGARTRGPGVAPHLRGPGDTDVGGVLPWGQGSATDTCRGILGTGGLQGQGNRGRGLWEPRPGLWPGCPGLSRAVPGCGRAVPGCPGLSRAVLGCGRAVPGCPGLSGTAATRGWRGAVPVPPGGGGRWGPRPDGYRNGRTGTGTGTEPGPRYRDHGGAGAVPARGRGGGGADATERGQGAGEGGTPGAAAEPGPGPAAGERGLHPHHALGVAAPAQDAPAVAPGGPRPRPPPPLHPGAGPGAGPGTLGPWHCHQHCPHPAGGHRAPPQHRGDPVSTERPQWTINK